MMPSNDFCTNRCSVDDSTPKIEGVESPKRHSNFCFDDGNIVVLAGDIYFIVHQGLLCRHSSPLASAAKTLEEATPQLVEGRPVLTLNDASNDVFCLLLALYDGISTLKYDINDFNMVSAILRLSTKYEISHIRGEIIRGMSATWPSIFERWESRELNAINSNGVYEPRKRFPHPILVINLARETGANMLLPAAFYDLSRCAPSDITAGYVSLAPSEIHRLSDEDLMNVLKGKEHTSRFFSTFVVSILEGREPAAACVYRQNENFATMRHCQAVFETITFEILRDVNGVVCQRTSDPLFAMMDAELMLTRNDLSSMANARFRACEYCRLEFGSAVDAARREFWQKLPLWFGLQSEI